MRQCQICSNPQREEIEDNINSGSMSIRGIARLYDLQHDALQRHATHHMGVADTTEDVNDSEYNSLDEINHLLRKNKATLDASKNPVQCQKLIQQQITLMEMKEKILSQKATTDSSIANYSKLNDEELKVIIRIQNRAMGLHDKDVIKDGIVTVDNEPHVPLNITYLHSGDR